MFTLNQLEVFLKVARCGSFSEAARRDGKAQSVMSTAVGNLEIELNTELFDRSGRLPRLTDAGRVLLEAGEGLLEQCNGFVDLASQLGAGVENSISFAVDGATPGGIAQEALQTLAQQFPHVHVSILNPMLNSTVELVRSGKAMLGLTPVEPDYGPDIAFKRLGDVALANVASSVHPIAQYETVSFAQLRGHRRLVYGPQADSLPTSEYLTSPLMWNVNSYVMLLDMLKTGLGWAVVPKHMIRSELAEGTLKELTLDNYPLTEWLVGLDLIWASKPSLGPAARRLQELIIQAGQKRLANTSRS